MEERTLVPNFFKYVSANVFGMIGLSCYILADTFFIARGVGADGLTALNLAIPVYSFMNGTGLMIGMGGATRYSLLFHTANPKTRNTVFTHAFCYATIASVFFFVIGLFFCGPLARILGADADILPLTKGYLQILLLFAPMFLYNNLLLSFLRNDSAPRLAMAGMLIGSFSNIILDYVFVFPLNMGMTGAALATGVAPVISMLVQSAHFLRKKHHFRLTRAFPRPKQIADISALGVSSLITEVSSGIVIIVFNFLILNLSGNLGVAAYGIVANIALVLVSVFTGVSQGIQPLLGRYFGAGKQKEPHRVLLLAFFVSLLFAAVSYIVIAFWRDPITELFNRDHNALLHTIAADGMMLYFPAFFFVGINICSATFLTCAEQPGWAFLLSSLRGFLLIIPVSLCFSALWGMTGIWLTMPFSEAAVTVLALFLLRKQKYSRKLKNSGFDD